MRSDPQYVDVSDPELFHLLCTEDDDRAPYAEFVRRFLPELNTFCKRKCELQSLDRHVGETIAHDVFERIRKSKTFNRDHFSGGDGHKWVLAYLLTSARRQFLDLFNKQKRQDDVPISYFDELRKKYDAIDPGKLKECKDLTELIVKKLTRNELAVAVADLEYKKHTKYLPDDVNLGLCEDLGITPAGVRQARARYKQKLNKAIDEINKA